MMYNLYYMNSPEKKLIKALINSVHHIYYDYSSDIGVDIAVIKESDLMKISELLNIPINNDGDVKMIDNAVSEVISNNAKLFEIYGFSVAETGDTQYNNNLLAYEYLGRIVDEW